MKLSVRFGLQQFVYFAAAASFFCYAVSFLLGKGFPAGQTGLLLGTSSVLSCFLQPLLGSLVDRSRKPILIPTLLVMTMLAAACYSFVLLVDLPVPVFAAVYLLGAFVFNSMTSLMNSITVYYRSEQEEIHYGVGKGLASISYGACSLVMGYVVVKAGVDAIMWIAVAILAVLFVVTAGFLKHTPNRLTATEKKEAGKSLSLPAFFRKYRRFTVNLLGIVCLSVFHFMTENFLIAIMENLGGNNSHQGTALFIATLASLPVLFTIDRVRKYISVRGLLLICGFFYVVKAVMFMIAASVTFIYAAQLLHLLTYAILAPALVYHADISVDPADMVKGQTIAGASFTLGGAIGNVLGGFFLENFGVSVILSVGVAMAVAGAVILLLSLKKDSEK